MFNTICFQVSIVVSTFAQKTIHIDGNENIIKEQEVNNIVTFTIANVTLKDKRGSRIEEAESKFVITRGSSGFSTLFHSRIE